MKKIMALILCLLFLLLYIVPVQAQDKPSSTTTTGTVTGQAEKTKWGAVWRSAVFPGWGQIYKGEKKKGIKLAVIEGFLIGGAYLTWQMSEQAKDKYLSATNQENIDKYYNEANQYHFANNYLTIGAIALWGYSIISIYTTDEDNFRKSENSKLNRLIYFTNNESIGIKLCRYF